MVIPKLGFQHRKKCEMKRDDLVQEFADLSNVISEGTGGSCWEDV